MLPQHRPAGGHGFYSKYVGSDDLLYVIQCLLASYGSGVNIGSYFSQYTANFVLSFAYHYAEGMAKERRGRPVTLVAHQLWYMDDCLLMASSKRDLSMAARRLEEYMGEALHYEVKPWEVQPVSQHITMVGYTVAPGEVRLRDDVFLRARRSFLRFERDPCIERAHRVVSYWGLLLHADTRQWRCDNRARETFDSARKMIGEHDRMVRQASARRAA